MDRILKRELRYLCSETARCKMASEFDQGHILVFPQVFDGAFTAVGYRTVAQMEQDHVVVFVFITKLSESDDQVLKLVLHPVSSPFRKKSAYPSMPMDMIDILMASEDVPDLVKARVYSRYRSGGSVFAFLGLARVGNERGNACYQYVFSDLSIDWQQDVPHDEGQFIPFRHGLPPFFLHSPGVFISHKWQDTEKASLMAASMRDRGVPCWLDDDDLPGEDHWLNVVNGVLPYCCGMLVICTASLCENPGSVAEEIKSAQQLNKASGGMFKIALLFDSDVHFNVLETNMDEGCESIRSFCMNERDVLQHISCFFKIN